SEGYFYWIDNSSVERLCFVSKENARRIIAGRFSTVLRLVGALPNPLSQFLSSTKSHNVPRRDHQGLAGSRVRQSSGLPVANVKRSETTESHRSFLCQTSLNTVEKCVYKNGHGTLRLLGRGRSAIDDVAFKHREMSFREIPLGTGSQFPTNLPRK